MGSSNCAVLDCFHWTRMVILFFMLFVVTDRISNISASSLFQDSFLEKSGGSNEPEFVEDIKNVTVASGREAVISCVVSNLGKYKVGWIRAEDQTILTLDSKVVTHNSRVGVTTDAVQTWNLHIRQVRESDRGCYMCQINTAVMRKQLGCIDVHVSPTIIDDETSADVTAREGDNVTLACRATGRPSPKIIWKREDGAKILVRRGLREAFKGYDNITGETLHFVRVDRKMQGAHFCLASNGVPPTKSKRIVLDVNFPPVIKVPSQLLGAPFGSELELKCEIEAMPKPFVYWMKNRGEMLMDGLGINNSTKYIIKENRVSYKVEMSLTIKNFAKKDVGIYYCVATNSLGKAEGTIRLHEVWMTRSTPRSTVKHTVTLQGIATPPMSTEMRNTGIHHTNKDPHWTAYDVDSRNPVVSAHDPRSPVNRDRDDNSSPMSSAATSIKAPLPPSHTLSHQIQRILSLLVVSFLPAFLFPLQNPLQNYHHHHHQGQNTALLLLLALILLLTTSTSASFIITHSPTHISSFLSR